MVEINSFEIVPSLIVGDNSFDRVDLWSCDGQPFPLLGGDIIGRNAYDQKTISSGNYSKAAEILLNLSEIGYRVTGRILSFDEWLAGN